MSRELLIELLVWLTIMFWNFDFCDWLMEGQHKMTVVNWVVTENYIKICKNTKDLHFIAYHELAHQFWWVKMSDNQREEYKELQTNNIVDYFQEYSMKNEAEDFADNFASIILNRVNRNGTENYRKKIDFINELLQDD